MEERDLMGRPVYAKVKVEEIKDRGGIYIVHCANAFVTFSFVTEEPPSIGEECELRITWKEKK